MMREMITEIKKQAIREACSENIIELSELFPNKESFIEALNCDSTLLMKLLPRVLRFPKELKLSSVDYIFTDNNKENAAVDLNHDIVIRVTTSDCSQKLFLKKNLDQLYEKICGIRMCFAFRLEEGHASKEWYDYN